MISSLFALLPLLVATLTRAEDHTIVVGGAAGLVFTPPTVQAAIGDRLIFEFHEKNHTATQSTFPAPCSPKEDGFDSGFNPVAPGTQSGFPQYVVSVNDTKPIWVFCQQPGPPAHCQKGMVFAANAPATGNTFDAFKAAAIASGGQSASIASTTATATSAWTSPPAPVVTTVTATVTVDGGSVYTTTYPAWEGATPNPTPAAAPAVHTIVVGGTAGLVFSPPTVQAAINDTILFEFHSKNHTATQSPFNQPCTNLFKATNGTKTGFDSGFMPVAVNATTFPTFSITVNDSLPIWGYCRQQGPPIHCQQGMVFGINPPTSGSNTFAAFQSLAEHINTTTSNTTSTSNTTDSDGGDGDSNGASQTAVSATFGLVVLAAVALAL